MLNRKRMMAVVAAVALTAVIQYSAAATAIEITSVETGIPYADDDPGRERLSGEVVLSGLEEDAADISNLLMMRAISAYSPFMGNTSYFHSDVFADREVVHGIDVSKYQKDIDWKAVKEAGVEYAIIRVGFRGYGKTGGMVMDTYFEQNIKGALEAGIEVGVYFFSQATTEAEAVEEAQYVLDKIKGYNITFPVVMDFEYASVNGKEGGRLYDANLSKTAATNVCLAFCETVENAGYEPMVYANTSMLKNKLNASDISSKYKIWLANYTSMTAYTGEYDFWQYSSKGTVNGITGNVDCNFWYKEVSGNDVVTPEGTPSDKEELPEVISPVVQEFSVGGRTNSRIRLNWTQAENVSGYRIYRYDEAAKGYKKLTTIQNGSETTWVDTGLEAGENYKYVIKSYIKDENGTYWSTKSEAVTAKTRTGAVEGFSPTVARKDKVRLSWQQTEGADGYRIYRYNSTIKTYEKVKTIGNGSSTTWVNSGLMSNSTYQYKIRAYIETENGTRYAGDYSNVVTVKTKK